MNAIQFLESRFSKEQLEFMDVDKISGLMEEYHLHQVNTPEVNNFVIGICNEAKHQQERWPFDPNRLPHHFILVASKIVGKMAGDVFDRDKDKLKHHVIALAAEMCNWHRLLMDDRSYSAAYFNSLSSTLDKPVIKDVNDITHKGILD